MFQYKKYRIKDTDSFLPGDFPKVIDELTDLNKGIAGIPVTYKEEILISFFKKHSLHNNWLIANPELASLINSGSLSTGHLESLFDSCQMNKQFEEEYENYIRENI